MKKFLVGFAFLFVLSQCKKDPEKISPTQQTVEKIPTFEVYGELAPSDYVDGYNPKHDSITKKYGFLVKRVADCEVTDDLVNKANRNNQKALEEMNKKYGHNWQSQFEKETGLKIAIPLQ